MFPILLWNWSDLSLFVILLLFPVLVLIIISRTPSKSQLPPCPPRLPILGNLHQVGSLLHQSLHALSNKHGPLMLLKLGEIPTLVVSSADMAREIMKTHDQIFASRPSFMTSDILLYGGRDVAFAPYGEHWRQMRKLCVNHLLSNKMVQSFRLVREQEVESMLTNISKISLSSGVVNMSEILNLYTTNVLIKAISGECFREGRSRVVHKLIEENVIILGQFNIGDLFPSLGWLDGIFGMGARAKRVAKRWDDVLDEIIEEHTNRSNEMEDTDDQEEKTTFLNVLLALQKDSNMDFNVERDIVKALLLDMIAAGIETSYL